MTAAALLGGCDLQLLEPFELPKWDVSLTLPLINRRYELATLAENDSTISQDTTTHEIQIEFIGTLDTTKIDSSLLEVELPLSATTQSISQTVDGINASDLFSPVEQSIQVVIALDSLLRAAPLPLFDNVSFPAPLPLTIPQADWNTHLASQTLEQNPDPVQVIDTTTAFQDFPFIERMRYLRLAATPFSSKFVTSVENNGFPTSIDSVLLSLSSGSLLSATHQNNSVAKDVTWADSADLASAQLGADIGFGLRLRVPQAAGDVTIDAGDSAKVIITIQITVGGVDSLAVTTAQASLVEGPPLTVELPSDIEIVSGVLRSGVAPSINQVNLTGLSSTLPFDLLFGLTFPNFASVSGGDTTSLSFGPYTISSGDLPLNDIKLMGGFIFYNPQGGGAISEFQVDVVTEVVAGDVAIALDGTPLGAFQVGIEFGDNDAQPNGLGDLHFASIEGNFQISFDAVNTTIEDIPTGFAGFEFARLSLALLLFNEIDLPVELNLNLVGRTLEDDSVSVPIIAPINYPGALGAPDDNGDTTSTLIILDGTSVRTYWLTEGSRDTLDAWFLETSPNSGGSIVDVLNLPPDIIEVAGAAAVEGQGVVEAGKGIWGEFELIAPFALIIPLDISFLPVDPIPLAPMDEETRETITTALLSASLTSQATTNFPFGGQISMLASDSTLFSLALDYLDDIDAGIPTAARTGDDSVYSSLQAVLEADSIYNVTQIVFFPESLVVGQTLAPENSVAKRVDFISALGDTFWVGRLFDMELPRPGAVNDLGWVTTPGDTTQIITLDAERVSWLASDTTVFLKTFITLYGTDGVRTIRSTDWIHFSAFISFNLTSEVFSAPDEPLESVIIVTAPGDTSVAPDSIVVIDLGTVFAHPEKDITDASLNVEATSSHTGIASVGRIPTTTRRLEIHGVGLGTAKITVTLDDLVTAPASASFLVVVVPAPSSRLAVKSGYSSSPAESRGKWPRVRQSGKVRP